MLYLLTSFPLGLLYFVFLITGLSLGLSLSIIWVGIPLLLLVNFIWWRLVAFERWLAQAWLKIPIRPLESPATTGQNWLAQLRTHFSSPQTWQTLGYLLLKFLFGILAFVVTIILLTVLIGLTTAPFLYIFQTWLYNLLNLDDFSSWVLYVNVTREFSPLKFLSVLPLPLLALVLAPSIFGLLNFLGRSWGRFAAISLGQSETALRLQAAARLIEQERQKAQRADQSRRELIVNVSHELRTPIASIRGHIESLMLDNEAKKDSNPDLASQQPYLNIVYHEAERLSNLVDDLLALARAEADELRLDIKPDDAAGVVNEVYENLAKLALREKEITLVREVAPELPPVLIDRQRLVQVVLNLVRNAINYTPQGGLVAIALEPCQPTHLALSVSDTGAGMSPDELAHIFERFYRTDTSRARHSGGFGLGLAIVRELVTAMGGSVSVESTPGQGSRFQILLPIANPPRKIDSSPLPRNPDNP